MFSVEHLPPDVSFGHDTLKSVTELKERLYLEQTDGGTRRVKSSVKKQKLQHFNRDDVTAAYPEEAVESVNGGEAEVQREKVKGDDADHVCLQQ